MKQITAFETCMAKTWAKDVPKSQKMEELAHLSQVIDGYAGRCRASLRSISENEIYKVRFVERAISHLEALSNDCRILAQSCRETKRMKS